MMCFDQMHPFPPFQFLSSPTPNSVLSTSCAAWLGEGPMKSHCCLRGYCQLMAFIEESVFFRVACNRRPPHIHIYAVLNGLSGIQFKNITLELFLRA